MTPEQLAIELNRLANYVETSHNPSRVKVASDLRAAMHLAGMNHEAGFMDEVKMFLSRKTGIPVGTKGQVMTTLKELEAVTKKLKLIKKTTDVLKTGQISKVFSNVDAVTLILEAFTKGGKIYTPSFQKALERSSVKKEDEGHGDLAKFTQEMKEIFSGKPRYIVNNAHHLQTLYDSIKKIDRQVTSFILAQIIQQLDALAEQLEAKADGLQNSAREDMNLRASPRPSAPNVNEETETKLINPESGTPSEEVESA